MKRLKKKPDYNMWVVFPATFRDIPTAVPVPVKVTATRAEVVSARLHPAVGYRTFLQLDDPRLQHRTPEAAIEYWHKEIAESIAHLREKISELEARNTQTPVIDADYKEKAW